MRLFPMSPRWWFALALGRPVSTCSLRRAPPPALASEPSRVPRRSPRRVVARWRRRRRRRGAFLYRSAGDRPARRPSLPLAELPGRTDHMIRGAEAKGSRDSIDPAGLARRERRRGTWLRFGRSSGGGTSRGCLSSLLHARRRGFCFVVPSGCLPARQRQGSFNHSERALPEGLVRSPPSHLEPAFREARWQAMQAVVLFASSSEPP